MAGLDLRAQRAQAAGRTNVVPLGVAGEARPRAVQAEAVAAPAPVVDADGRDDTLAALDELLATQNEGAAPVGPVATRTASVAAPATAPAPPGELRGSAPLSLTQGIKLVNQTHFVAPHAGQSTIWRDSIDHDTGMRTVVPASTPRW